MNIFSKILIVVVAIVHIGFLILEMFLLPNGIGLERFNLTPNDFESVWILAPLAKNQGLYNSFLGIGLLWGLWQKQQTFIFFFLICAIIAGIYGAMTIQPSILFFQALPAAFALLVTRLHQGEINS